MFGGSGLKPNLGAVPLGRVPVLPIQLVEIDDDVAAVPPDCVAIHAARGATGNEHAVGPVTGVVLGALELVSSWRPSHRFHPPVMVLLRKRLMTPIATSEFLTAGSANCRPRRGL